MRRKKKLKQNVRTVIWMLFINMVKLGKGNRGFYVLYAAGNLLMVPGDLKSGTGRHVLCVER